MRWRFLYKNVSHQLQQGTLDIVSQRRNQINIVDNLRKHLLALFIALALIGVSGMLLGHAVADVAAQASEAKSITRDLEPVVVYGSQVPSLIGASVDDLFVYTFNGEVLSGQIPFQIDEVTAGGNYTTTDDGLLGANDEIVFMAMDLGDRPADPTILINPLSTSGNWYELEAGDPLSPNQKGWAYLVHSSALTPGFGDDYVDITSVAQSFTIDAAQYELHLSTVLPAIDYLAMNGSGSDILDRSKIRVVLEFLGSPFYLTEGDLTNPDTVLVKDGPVRGILRQTAVASPGGTSSEVGLVTTNLAYASLVDTTAEISFTLPSLVELTYARMSIDLDSGASGATFYNANTSPGGEIIDGDPDTVAGTPLSNWAQISHPSGRLIWVVDPSLVGGTQANYYCDDNGAGTLECDATPETGDGVAYGDAGISIEGNISEDFTTESSFFILPSAGGGQDNVGATYNDYHFNPIGVSTRFQAHDELIFIPIVLKNSR